MPGTKALHKVVLSATSRRSEGQEPIMSFSDPTYVCVTTEYQLRSHWGLSHIVVQFVVVTQMAKQS